MKTTITDVFFDLDHTLWDFEKNSALTFAKILHKNNIDVDHAAFLEHYVPINYRYWDLFRDDKISKQQMRLGRLQETFALLNKIVDEEQISVLADDYIAFLPENTFLFEGTIELLEYLKPKYNLHIITNGFKDLQNYKLKNSNLTPYFKTVTNSESAGVKKPNPIIYEYALQQANAKKEQSVMIGDCIHADVLGALNCGIDAILFSEIPQVLEDKTIKQISHLLDLKKYL
ncbi:YjjG family noncanonical pyrimidine nucleotidase [Flavobacterium antarcticum]|uniref:YjjG family noncanonical pyrimidine nucleotidase n=1 Tax=Flavobacterium antarcticum TaxID=271155 RepID=UPI0003B6416F|nr:YjjG family noncanonical pyrimidine nucleotidase [Flavobacterium antarcticum]